MKKALLSLALVISFAFYALFASSRSDSGAVAEPQKVLPLADAAASSSAYKDGTYTGPATDAYFGTLQVQATVAGGRLADVAFLQYPNDRGTSVQINTRAMPILKSEAIRSQSAKVDVVSGATQTSQAFQQSLAGALASATD